MERQPPLRQGRARYVGMALVGRAKLETDELTLRRVAVVLECASLEGDKAAIAKHGVTLRTVQRWREAFRTREKVAQYVALHRKALSEEYNLKASEAMQAHATMLFKLALKPNLDSEMVRAVNDGMRSIHQFILLEKSLDGRLAGVDVFGDGSQARIQAPEHVDAAFEVVEDGAADPTPDPD